MPIEQFYYHNLNEHFLPASKDKESSSESKYENMTPEEIWTRLESKKMKPIKPTGIQYRATLGDSTISDQFFVIRRNVPILVKEGNAPDKAFLVSNRLKFHISLPEDKYAEGWDVVMPILIAREVVLFKIPHQGESMSSQKGQYGKDITVYADKNPNYGIEDWQEILTQITDALVKAQIPPGYKTARTETESKRFDNEITGSKYISYRYDTKKTINKDEDPCIRLRINVDQPYEPQIFGQDNAAQVNIAQGQSNNVDRSCCTKCNII